MVKMTIGAATDFNTNSGRGAAVASAPVAVRPPDLSGTGLIGSSLRVDPGAWRGQPAPELTFQWQRNGIDIPETVEAVYTPGPADDEADLRCVVTARNGSGRTTAATEAIRITYAPPRLLGELPDVTYDLMADGSRMVLAGQNFSGENLSFSVTGADAVIYPRSGGLSIPTSAPRVAEPVTIVASNSGGQAQVTFNVTISSVSDIPPITPPFVIGAPALSGAGLIGTPVQADPGVWGGLPAPALALQWQRDGVDIPAATGTLYIPAAEDDGMDLRCVVTAANGANPVKVVTETIRVRYAPPSALGGLFDEVFDQYSGIELISTAQDFIGENLTFSVSGAGAEIELPNRNAGTEYGYSF